jgi:hypothetical protein
VPVDRVRTHHQELALGQPRHRQVGLDPTALVGPLGVGDPTGGHIEVVAAQPVEQRQGIPALHEELRHEGHVHEDDAFPAGAVL